jgi:hypothetical protein
MVVHWCVGLLACAAFFAAATATGGAIPHARGDDDASATWLAWGGETRFHFNPDALRRLGLRIERAERKSARVTGEPGLRYEVLAFRAREADALEIRHRGRVVSGLGGGSLRHSGGPVLRFGSTPIDLRGFVLRASAGVRFGIDVAGADGAVWFTADHAHYGFEDGAESEFAMRHMNLRLSAHFAAALGHPEWSGFPVGGLEFHVHAYATRETADVGGVCDAPWPSPGSGADVQAVDGDFSGFRDDVYVPRCSGCTATSTDGMLVVSQDASLRNAGTTSVAWYRKFGGDFPPYGYDQHPFLIWNLYRLDADGRLRQIGASGAKHAFYTVNYNCPCGGGHELYPTCEDVYSSYTNDTSTNLGPRSEIIPHAGRWGRCGSVYDRDCDGVEDTDGGARDLYEFRMTVGERDLLPPLADGARYLQEYWYVVRDDDAIYDAMGWREVFFRKNGADWSASLVDPPEFHAGPVVDFWVAPETAAQDSANAELSSALGRARVAVRVTDLGDGHWRYRYAVMNFDYAHAEIDAAHPAEPDLRVVSNHGFERFRVPLGPAATASALLFDDADADPADDWTAAVDAGYVTWTAPASGNTLDWGIMYAFELVANAPPASGEVELAGVATATEPGQHHLVRVRVPAAAADLTRNGSD